MDLASAALMIAAGCDENLTEDSRFWFANKTSIVNRTIRIPADASGECTLYLNLPDPKPTLHDKPDFSIRLANDDVWDSNTGYNKVMTFTL